MQNNRDTSLPIQIDSFGILLCIEVCLFANQGRADRMGEGIVFTEWYQCRGRD